MDLKTIWEAKLIIYEEGDPKDDSQRSFLGFLYSSTFNGL
jgi:hypothetical protein